jgi:hypothetical protein
MIAAEPAAPAILEGELPGDIPENARKRDWLPGRCGLLPHLALCSGEQGAGRTAGHRRGRKFVIAR